MHATQKSNQVLPALALAATVIVWAVTPSLVRAFALETGPADSIVIRMFTNALFALPLLLWLGPKIDRKDFVALLFVSFVGNFGYYVGSNFGFANLSPGAGGMLYATNPLMIAGLSIVMGTDRLSPAVILGLVISFAGTVYLFADGLGNAGGNPVLGGLMMLFGCAAWAVYVVFAKPLIQKYGPIKLTLWTTVLCVFPALLFFNGQTLHTASNLSHDAVLALLIMALIGTLLSVNLWNYAAGQLSPASVGASLYLIPPCIALFGWLFLGEATGLHTLFAGLIILTGVAVAEFGKILIMPAKEKA